MYNFTAELYGDCQEDVLDRLWVSCSWGLLSTIHSAAIGFWMRSINLKTSPVCLQEQLSQRIIIRESGISMIFIMLMLSTTVYHSDLKKILNLFVGRYFCHGQYFAKLEEWLSSQSEQTAPSVFIIEQKLADLVNSPVCCLRRITKRISICDILDENISLAAHSPITMTWRWHNCGVSAAALRLQ